MDEELSATALSRQDPVRPIDRLAPSRRQAAVNAAEVHDQFPEGLIREPEECQAH